METKTAYLIICEGDPEYAYVQELNRYLNEKGCRIVLLPCNAGGGGFSSIRQICRAKKTRRNGRTFVFVDRDIYFRNDNGDGTSYETEKDVLPPFLFQTWNFEDFLLMHYPAEIISEWRTVSRQNGHAEMPKHGEDFKPIYEDFCQAHNDVLKYDLPYEKGDMPFPLTEHHVKHLIENNRQAFPSADFAELIEKFRAWGLEFGV